MDGRDGTVEGQFTEETPAALVARLAGHVAPGDGAAHARFIAQIWGDAAVTPELAAVARSAHQRLEEHLAGLLAEHGGNEAEAAATARVALASLIGLSALVASDVPVDTASFVRVVTRLLDR